MTHRALWLALTASILTACSATAPRTDAELSQAAKQGDGRAQYELARRLASQPTRLPQCHALDAAGCRAVWSLGRR